MYVQKIFLAILGLSLLPVGFTLKDLQKTVAKTQADSIPSEFQTILQTQGIQVYQRITDILSPTPTIRKEFITVVDISKASLRNLTGNLTENKTGEIKVSKKTLTQFWKDSHGKSSSNKKIQVILNGAFFSTKQNPTGIAFGLQTNGKLITYGYGVGNEYPGQITTFAFQPSLSNAAIGAYIPRTFIIYPEVVGALHPLANKSANKYLPRTFVGIKDKNKDGVNETVIFYSSNYARQIDAIATLRKFGTHRNAMLDGGGSTGIIVNGTPLIITNRPIPHAIAIYQ